MDKRWDPDLYDRDHSFVWERGLDLIEILAPRPGERILDLGCGTGHLTYRIACSGAETIGIDISPEMIERARSNYPDIRFEVADGANFHFEEPFDAVFSNAALHWITDQRAAAACIWRALRPGGRLVAELGGKGNISALLGAVESALRAISEPSDPIAHPASFPTLGQFAALLEAQGFLVTYASFFERPTPLKGGQQGLRNWIEVFAEYALQMVPPHRLEEFFRMVEDQLRPILYREGTWFADYRRLRITARKPTI
jgi:trans-aconitate 2-methyltransferase